MTTRTSYTPSLRRDWIVVRSVLGVPPEGRSEGGQERGADEQWTRQRDSRRELNIHRIHPTHFLNGWLTVFFCHALRPDAPTLSSTPSTIKVAEYCCCSLLCYDHHVAVQFRTFRGVVSCRPGFVSKPKVGTKGWEVQDPVGIERRLCNWKKNSPQNAQPPFPDVGSLTNRLHKANLHFAF